MFSFNKKEMNESDILNIALGLSLEWGENWIRPIDKRLMDKVSDLEEIEAKEIDKYIAQIREDIYDIVEQHYLEILTETETEQKIYEKYPFINESNFNHIFSQGMYYAWRNNG